MIERIDMACIAVAQGVDLDVAARRHGLNIAFLREVIAYRREQDIAAWRALGARERTKTAFIEQQDEVRP